MTRGERAHPHQFFKEMLETLEFKFSFLFGSKVLADALKFAYVMTTQIAAKITINKKTGTSC